MKKNKVTKSLADHFLTSLASTRKLFALRSASTSFNKSNSRPFFFSSSAHLANSFPSSFSLCNSFSKWTSTSVLYRTAQMIPRENRMEQSDGIHDLWQASLLYPSGSLEEEALKRRTRDMEWKRKKKMYSIVISFRTESIWVSLRVILPRISSSSLSHCLRRSLWVGVSAIWWSGCRGFDSMIDGFVLWSAIIL